MLSRRFKDSFKLALSMVIATGIALSMDWDKPFWAALAIFMCSFTASGDSLSKGLLRIGGTFAGVIVTLVLVSVAPQDRWLFLSLITGWILFCAYMLTGTTRGYFWMCAAFTVPILAMSGGVHPAASFDTVILRAQETSLGVIVYSLVSYLIWPASGDTALRTAIGTVIDAQRRTAGSCLGLMAGGEDDQSGNEQRDRALPILGRLPAMLDGAVLDSVQIRNRRGAWRRVLAGLRGIEESLERWHSSLDDVRKLDLETLLPGLARFGAEIDRRLLAVQQMLRGQAPACSPATVDCGLEDSRLASLPLFDRVALISCVDQMNRVDRLCASLFADAAAVQGAGGAREAREAPAARPGGTFPAFDPDRFLYAVRPFLAVWLACLLAIYVPGLPGSVIFIAVANSVSLALAMMPQVPPTLAQGPVIKGLMFAGFVYMLVMPRLSGFPELSIVFFVAVFGIAYRFPLEKAPIARPVWLAALVLCTAVSNEQSYSFLHWANLMLPLILAVWLTMLTGYFPVSYQPQDRFLHQLRRFFRSCRFLLSDAQWSGDVAAMKPDGFLERFHAHEVSSIPGKMLAFCGGVQARIGSAASPSARSLVATLPGLRQSIPEVHAARAEIAPHVRQLPGALQEELSTWRSELHDLFARLSENPEALVGTGLAERLEAGKRHLAASVESTLNEASGSDLADADALRLYRLLAALKDMSVSLVRFQCQAEAFAWDKLRESRF